MISLMASGIAAVRWRVPSRVTNRHAGGHAATAEVPPKAAVVLRRTCHKGSLSLVPVDQAYC
jgi:hypothetical protein